MPSKISFIPITSLLGSFLSLQAFHITGRGHILELLLVVLILMSELSFQALILLCIQLFLPSFHPRPLLWFLFSRTYCVLKPQNFLLIFIQTIPSSSLFSLGRSFPMPLEVLLISNAEIIITEKVAELSVGITQVLRTEEEEVRADIEAFQVEDIEDLWANSIEEDLRANKVEEHDINILHFRPSYNVSPGAYLPVFTLRCKGSGTEAGELGHAVRCMKWGLVPSFTKKTEKPDHYRMFNARSESIKEKASFRRLVPNNRCLVAVEGFYEWKKDGSKKQPYYIHFKDHRPLVFAALYDSWTNSEGEILHTVTILTTHSSSSLEWLHDRMPVIFGNKGSMYMWLSDSPLKLETVLIPYADSDLVWYPVTPAMGKSSFEGPECIKEIPLKPAAQNQISKLFSRKFDDKVNKCKPEPEFGKPSNDFPKNDKTGNLKEEPDMEDTREFEGEKTLKDDYFTLPERKNVVPELHGIKRELEDVGPDLEIKFAKSDSYSTSAKKKPQTGDKQASLFSYFGRK